MSFLGSGDEWVPEPKLSALEEQAWELYCKETAGDMHVLDYWQQLLPRIQRIYLKKAREANGKNR